MADPRLLDYIRSEISSGFSEQQIRQALITNNYPQNVIDEAFMEIRGIQPKAQSTSFQGQMQQERLGLVNTGAQDTTSKDAQNTGAVEKIPFTEAIKPKTKNEAILYMSGIILSSVSLFLTVFIQEIGWILNSAGLLLLLGAIYLNSRDNTPKSVRSAGIMMKFLIFFVLFGLSVILNFL